MPHLMITVRPIRDSPEENSGVHLTKATKGFWEVRKAGRPPLPTNIMTPVF